VTARLLPSWLKCVLCQAATPTVCSEELLLRAMPHDISLQLAEEDFSDIKKVGERADVLWHIELQNSAGITCNCFKVDRPTSKKKSIITAGC